VPIVDTGPLVATADRAGRNHKAVVDDEELRLNLT
jgi:hypothetical protein